MNTHQPRPLYQPQTRLDRAIGYLRAHGIYAIDRDNVFEYHKEPVVLTRRRRPRIEPGKNPF
jgi:hypothetical protein